jgi:hypothetical protein
MVSFNKALLAALAAFFILVLSACSPEVGTDSWCSNMKEKPKGEWTANDTTSFAKSCLFK